MVSRTLPVSVPAAAAAAGARCADCGATCCACAAETGGWPGGRVAGSSCLTGVAVAATLAGSSAFFEHAIAERARRAAATTRFMSQLYAALSNLAEGARHPLV